MRRIESALLVDDDDAFRTTLQGALRRRGVPARTAATAQEGLVALEDEPADLVVLDYRMPRADGLTSLPRFRAAAPKAVIIMLTAFGDIPLAVAAMREGADTLLSKPIDADRLIQEASNLRERQRGTAPPALISTGTYNLESIERDTITAALQAGGGVSGAARLLGIDRRTLQRKLKKLR
jgi:two-component system, response regulator RegA